MPAAKRNEKKVRTTVSLPARLYEEVRSVVITKAASAGSINGLFVSAIRAYVNLIKRRQIDAQFARMSKDPEYQKDAVRISEEFSASDWEAFERAEKDSL
jgi:hypothetical protein